MSVRTADARATLARLGIDPEALLADGAAADRLVPLVTGADGRALVEALAELPGTASAALLVALEPHAADRTVRKAIRRARYRLRQRGVAVPEPTATPPAHRAEPEPEGFLTAFGGDGDRILWLVKPLRDGGFFLVYAHVHDQRGLRALTTAEVGRKRLLALRRQLEARGAIRLVAAGWRVIDALLVEAEGHTRDDESHASYLKVRSRITAEPPDPPAEPASHRLAPPGSEEIPALVAGSAALLAEPELATWMPPADQLAPFVEELASAHDSPLVLSRAAQEERVRAVIRRAVDALVPPVVLVRRLEATAYVLAETGREPLARQALAVATVLRTRPEQTAEVPLAIALVERPIAALLTDVNARRGEQQKGSLVVTPGQFLRDRSSARPSRTRA